MDRCCADKTKQQTTFPSWIIGVIFQDFAGFNNRELDLRYIKIFFQPFLLRMKADFVLAFVN